MRIVRCALALLSLAACKTEPPQELPPPRERPPVLSQPLPPMPEGHPDLGALKVSSRGPRRMSVDQLEQSLDVIGNLPPGTVKLPADLAVTLGRPDFNRVTEESLQPSALFMKFMLDLGAIYCRNLGDAENGRAAQERVFTRYASVDQNLHHLLLRFTGIEGDAGATYLPRLKAAYDRGGKSARPLAGYESACIALFTSPEFLLY